MMSRVTLNQFIQSQRSMVEAIDLFLLESTMHRLTRKQQRYMRQLISDNRTPQGYSDSDHAFGGKSTDGYQSTDRISIPLESDHTTPNQSVIDHLNHHGYSVSDYTKGLATKADGSDTRQTSIGKILHRTNASPEVHKAFANDPARNSANRDTHVVISRHAEDVACHSNFGVKTCQTVGSDGEPTDPDYFNIHGDLQGGNHVAYLCDKDDHEAKAPIARIMLRRWFGNDTGHPIYRPSLKTYGTAPDSFHKTVSKWAEQNFPMKDSSYHQDEDSGYRGDEGSQNTIWNPDVNRRAMKKIATSKNEHSTRDMLENPYVPTDILHSVLDKNKNSPHGPDIFRDVANHPNADESVLERVYSSHDGTNVQAVLRHPNCPHDFHRRALEDGHVHAVASASSADESSRNEALQRIANTEVKGNKDINNIMSVLAMVGGDEKSTPDTLRNAYEVFAKHQNRLPHRYANHIISNDNTPTDVLDRELVRRINIKGADKANYTDATELYSPFIQSRNLSKKASAYLYKHLHNHPAFGGIGGNVDWENFGKNPHADSEMLQKVGSEEKPNVSILRGMSQNPSVDKHEFNSLMKKRPELIPEVGGKDLSSEEAGHLMDSFMQPSWRRTPPTPSHIAHAATSLIRSSSARHSEFVSHPNVHLRRAAFGSHFADKLRHKDIDKGLNDDDEIVAHFAENRKTEKGL